MKGDTHFAVNKNTGLIVYGWDYSDIEGSELRQFKKDYFIDDLVNNGFNPREYSILTRKACEKRGIDPDNQLDCWSNMGDISLADEKSGVSESKRLEKFIDEEVRRILNHYVG